MSRQYFMDVIYEPTLADILTYSTVTTEALLWPVAINTLVWVSLLVAHRWVHLEL